MNHYEELGISRGATAEEILQAHKMMARLLQPDCQADPHMRALAERQMKRIGDVVATLLNSQKKRQYDGGLGMGNRPQVPIAYRAVTPRAISSWERGAVGRLTVLYWFWIMMGIVVLGLGAWDIVGREANVQASAPPAAAASPRQRVP